MMRQGLSTVTRPLAPRISAPAPREWLSGGVIVTITALWSAVVIGAFIGDLNVAFVVSNFDACAIALPVLLALTWATSARAPSTALRVATGFSAVIAAIVLLTPRVLSDPLIAAVIPVLVILTWVLYRRPAVGVVAMLAVTASFGSLFIYVGWPYKKTIAAVLIALWFAALIRLIRERRQAPIYAPAGVMLVVGYLLITIIQVILASDQSLALSGFQLGPLYMMSMLVVAYSQWPLVTHERVVQALMLIAVLAGAYATLRYAIGPSTKERILAHQSPYNFVDGKEKLLGSFASAPDLAEWAALMIPFCLACALGLRGRTRKLACLALPLLAVGLFGSQVRAASLATGAAVLLTAVMLGRSRAFPGVRLGQSSVAVAVIVALGIASYVVAGSSSQHSGHSYLALISGSHNDVSLNAHLYKWKVAFRDLTGHPFGYGLGTAPAGYTGAAPATSRILPVSGFSVDNGFLKIALEQGFSVMLVFGVALALLAAGLLRGGVTSTDRVRATIALGAAGTAASFFVLEGAGAFADGVPAIAGWVVIGLGLAQFVVGRRREPSGS